MRSFRPANRLRQIWNPLYKRLKVVDTLFRLFDSAALDAENNIPWSSLANLDYLRPVDNTVTTGTAYRRTGNFAAFTVRLGNRDILGVKMHKPVGDPFKPDNGIMSTKIAVTRIEIDSYGRCCLLYTSPSPRDRS